MSDLGIYSALPFYNDRVNLMLDGKQSKYFNGNLPVLFISH
jgi:hypothetical protein